MDRDSFVFYKSFYNAIKCLNEDERVMLYDAICEYALNHNELKLDGVCNSLFTLMKPNIDANYKKWLNGCKGGVPKGTINNPKGKNQFSNKVDNQKDNQKDNNRINNVNVNENENVNDDEKISRTFRSKEEKPIISLPLNIKNAFKHIYSADVLYYQELYPNVDIHQELRSMLGWLNSHPKKRKTNKGIDAFINNWLSRKQDNPSTSQINKTDDKFSIDNIMKFKEVYK